MHEEETIRTGVWMKYLNRCTTGLHIKKVYTSLGTSSPNAYTKSYCCLLMHVCISMEMNLNAYTTTQITGLHIKKAYTSLGTSSPNAYTKSYCCLLMHVCISIKKVYTS